MSSKPDLQIILGDSLTGEGADNYRTYGAKFNNHTHPASTLTSFTSLRSLESTTFDVITSDHQVAVRDAEFSAVTDTILTLSKPSQATDPYAVLVLNDNRLVFGVSITQGSRDIVLQPNQSIIQVSERRLLRLRTISGILLNPKKNVSYPVLMNPSQSGKIESISVYATEGSAQLTLVINTQVLSSGVLADTSQVRTIAFPQSVSQVEFSSTSNLFLRSSTDLILNSTSQIHYSINLRLDP